MSSIRGALSQLKQKAAESVAVGQQRRTQADSLQSLEKAFAAPNNKRSRPEDEVPRSVPLPEPQNIAALDVFRVELLEWDTSSPSESASSSTALIRQQPENSRIVGRPFQALFLHQLFDGHEKDESTKQNTKLVDEDEDEGHPLEERIVGYHNPSIVFSFTAASLMPTVAFTYSAVDAPEVTKSATPVLEKLKKWFPNELHACLAGGPSGAIFQAQLQQDCTWSPPGSLVQTYFLSSGSEGASSKSSKDEPLTEEYQIYRSTFENENARDFHQRAEFFSILYIDGARYIDLTDQNWIVYHLFAVSSSSSTTPSYRFLGYITVYAFYHYPESTRLRVAQIFVLPPFQRRGHAERLLRAVYSDARTPQCTNFVVPSFSGPALATQDTWPSLQRQWNGQLFDVTVEDPAPGFQRLRDFVDMVDCLNANVFPPGASFPLTSELLEHVTTTLKLTRPQVYRMYHLIQLDRLIAKPNEQESTLLTNRVKNYLKLVYIDTLAASTDPIAEVDRLFIKYSEALVPVIHRFRAFCEAKRRSEAKRQRTQ